MNEWIWVLAGWAGGMAGTLAGIWLLLRIRDLRASRGLKEAMDRWPGLSPPAAIFMARWGQKAKRSNSEREG